VELSKSLWDSGKTKIFEEMKRISTMADVIYVRQKEQLGLGHAILCAKEIIKDEPFAVLLPDDVIRSKEPVMGQLVRQYERVNANVVSLMHVAPDATHKYGIVKIDSRVDDKLSKLADMVEKPKANPPSDMAIIGRYILTPEIIEILEKTRPAAGNEIQLTDALLAVAKQGKVFGYEFEGDRFDCGDRVGLLEATMNFAAGDPALTAEYKRIVKEIGL
jgi:UTP--glucose-1-phosphate uridylyltransferase